VVLAIQVAPTPTTSGCTNHRSNDNNNNDNSRHNGNSEKQQPPEHTRTLTINRHVTASRKAQTRKALWMDKLREGQEVGCASVTPVWGDDRKKLAAAIIFLTVTRMISVRVCLSVFRQHVFVADHQI
jgi:hypothetical protein